MQRLSFRRKSFAHWAAGCLFAASLSIIWSLEHQLSLGVADVFGRRFRRSSTGHFRNEHISRATGIRKADHLLNRYENAPMSWSAVALPRSNYCRLFGSRRRISKCWRLMTGTSAKRHISFPMNSSSYVAELIEAKDSRGSCAGWNSLHRSASAQMCKLMDRSRLNPYHSGALIARGFRILVRSDVDVPAYSERRHSWVFPVRNLKGFGLLR